MPGVADPNATGRFAPSPTGPLHLGNLRTALLAWLFARSAGARFLLRIEDLDPVATREEHVTGQPADLAALGLDWNGPIERQSEHLDRSHAAIARLEAEGLTYPCYCTRREIQEAAAAPHGKDPMGAYPGTCRDLTAAERDERAASGRRPALRLRAGDVAVAFEDRLRGRVEGRVDDLVLRRTDGIPAYNLAVVVDDAAQGVGEVVRGDDLLPSTPRQIHLARLLGVEPPTYAHVPLVLGPDGTRLAKRHGAVTLADRRARGESPSDVLAYLASTLGLARPDEPVTPTDLIERFDPTEPLVLDPRD
ncbi:MAG: tRNA glutamyl-Q(34) synthetase GluQRS [Acidimicrobiia bacterium]|nr:tRNA glutamyl-Q(34) synthetase GluQRS [Acidimicrobiia bacterium]